MSASDSHRAEVRNKLKELIVDITVDHDSDTLEEVTDVYVDAIMALLDSERERWIKELRDKMPMKIDFELVPDKSRMFTAKEAHDHVCEVLDVVSTVLDDMDVKLTK